MCFNDMLNFFKTVRSFLDYGCPVWHNSLTGEQCDLIESIQKRAFKIICGSCYSRFQLSETVNGVITYSRFTFIRFKAEFEFRKLT